VIKQKILQIGGVQAMSSIQYPLLKPA